VLDDVVRGEGHVARVGADHDDVVRVVRDGRRHRAGFEPVALDVAEADVVGVLMALDHRNLEDVLLEVDALGIAVVGRDDLARDHADDAALAGVPEIVLREMAHMEGVVRAVVEILLDLRRREVAQRAVVIVQLALFVDHLDVEVLEVVDDGKVGEVAGRDGAAVVEQEVARRVMCRGFDCDDGIDAELVDGAAADVVDMALLKQVVRMLVVGAEHAALGILGRQQRGERLEIAGGRALADHDELAALELGQRVLHGRALVVGVDADRDVGVEVLALQARRVAVDLLVVRLRGHDLGDDFGVVVNDAVGVHHLGETLHAGIVVVGVDRAVVEIRAGLVHGRRGHAGREHEAHVDGQTLGRLEHVVDAVGAHDVRDLMRVGDDGGGAVRQHRARELPRGDKAGFEMDVRVDEAGADNLARHVDFLFALVAAEADDQSICHRDVAGAQLVGKDVDIGGVFKHQIGLFPAGGGLDDPLLLEQLPLNFSCVAFHGCRHIASSFLAFSFTTDLY